MRRGETNLDLNGVELLAVVDTDNASDHLGENDHVAKVGLDHRGLLTLGHITLLPHLLALRFSCQQLWGERDKSHVRRS